MPNQDTGILPNEIWFSARGNLDIELPRTHVFGCPVYILDPALQDGKKIPKWNPCACLGLFLGFSDLHSSQVLMVLNVTMGKISPQFHVIFDDKFSTVHSLPVDQPLTMQWSQLLQLGHESFTDLDYGVNGEPILPSLLEITRSYSEQCQQQNDLHNFQPRMLPGDGNEVIFDIDDEEGAAGGISEEGIYEKHPGIISVPEGAPSASLTVPEGTPNTNIDTLNKCPRRNVGTYKDGPANIRKFPIEGEEYNFTFNTSILSKWDHPVPAVLNKGRVEKNYHPQKKISKEALAECYLMQTGWIEDPSNFLAFSQNILLDSWDLDNYYFNEISDPWLLAAGQTKSQKITMITPPLIWLRMVPFKRNFGRLCESNSILSSMSLIVGNMYPTPGKLSCLAHGHSKSNAIQMVE
jgi:hypothetical protein